jgi:hypothetical protein
MGNSSRHATLQIAALTSSPGGSLQVFILKAGGLLSHFQIAHGAMVDHLVTVPSHRMVPDPHPISARRADHGHLFL